MNKARFTVISILFCALAVCTAGKASAQEGFEAAPAEEGSDHSVSVSLNQDIFFGFYGIVAGAYKLDENLAFTYYSILWTTPSFGADAPSGFGLWTEFGAGVNFTVGNLDINPQLGLLNGRLLSGANRGLFGEGIVPNLTVNYDDDLFEGEFYFGYYLALRRRGGEAETDSDFIHYWANVGVKAPKLVSGGLHFEQLIRSRSGAGADMDSLYRWIGPYVQFASGNTAVRFSAGLDFNDTDNITDFYKMSVVMDF